MKKYPRSVKFIGSDEFFLLYQAFIKQSEKGMRTKKNGDFIRSSSINNYQYTLKLLLRFCATEKFEMRLYLVDHLNPSDLSKAQKYWKSFYHTFTDFLYVKLGHFDNYVGFTIKNIRTFFNYLNDEIMLNIGTYHKQFHVPKEDIQIVVLSPEQLNYLIYDKQLNERLSPELRKVKDVFVFGCTVALRYSDLSGLRNFNIVKEHDGTYLKVHSHKTGIESLIKLPGYAIDIISRYSSKKKYLLPHCSLGNFNNQLKKLGEFISPDYPMPKVRMRRGIPIEQFKISDKKESFHMSDHITSHTMRRTAITTMLRLGMPEAQVRRISGHTAGSKEFYKYIAFSQVYLDQETDLYFKKLKSRQENVSKNT